MSNIKNLLEDITEEMVQIALKNGVSAELFGEFIVPNIIDELVTRSK